MPYTYNFPDAHPERFIRFNPRYYNAIVEGRKTATTRLNEPGATGPAWLLFEFDETYKRLPAEVELIETKTFDELTDADARAENAATAEDLRGACGTTTPPSPTPRPSTSSTSSSPPPGEGSTSETERAGLPMVNRRMRIRPWALTLLIVLAACGVALFVLPPGMPTQILGAVLIVVAFAVLIVSERAGRSGR
ncbi:ASCH domain-containing protein [Curtobacterium sp. MCBD17_035]|uniref:ASCH domain-containing protein n=1 Tax=Curtobacterium sp. MCBD17_035 TaxID=2175673 RepID=UPI0015E8D28B|nr:ASCH domain-containing protein [Curtobacterium sp. MCBD17_035]WIB68920.1 ASCH domain-containing protein [Curtobacterium sp. MCBD17_035]